jgi:hypothetical protein
MAASPDTIKKILRVLRDHECETVVQLIVRRLWKETVPSGNKSYDVTVRRLMIETQQEPR